MIFSFSWSCRHDKVYIRRAHKSVHVKDHGKEAWIDKLGVYNHIVCCRCNKILETDIRETIFGEE